MLQIVKEDTLELPKIKNHQDESIILYIITNMVYVCVYVCASVCPLPFQSNLRYLIYLSYFLLSGS